MSNYSVLLTDAGLCHIIIHSLAVKAMMRSSKQRSSFREPPVGARRWAKLPKLAFELSGGRVSTPVRLLRYSWKRVKRWGCGAVGARFLGMEEAAGSIPASSTKIDLYQYCLLYTSDAA